MRKLLLGALAVMAVTACGGGAGSSSGGGGGGGNSGVGGAGGAGGAGAVCPMPMAPLHLVFTMPDGQVFDSNQAVSQLNDASADLTGAATVVIGSEIQVKDDTTSEIAKLHFEGTGSPQVNDGQKIHMVLRFAPRQLGGPDAYQAEIEDATSGVLLFVAVQGYIKVFPGVRVSVTLGNETCSEIDEPMPMSVGAGTGAGYRLHEVVVDAGGGASVAIPNGATEKVITKSSIPLSMTNQSAAEFITPPEGYLSVAVAGQAAFPPD